YSFLGGHASSAASVTAVILLLPAAPGHACCHAGRLRQSVARRYCYVHSGSSRCNCQPPCDGRNASNCTLRHRAVTPSTHRDRQEFFLPPPALQFLG